MEIQPNPRLAGTAESLIWAMTGIGAGSNAIGLSIATVVIPVVGSLCAAESLFSNYPSQKLNALPILAVSFGIGVCTGHLALACVRVAQKSFNHMNF